jgi:ABC-type bacteriocin/lantibiotic exporter with double-glycine peptidase domain
MRYQMRGWSCGPASLVNACRALGFRVAEGRIRALSGTTEEGSDEYDLIPAARELGLTATPHHSADQAAAWAFVRANVMDGRPCLLCIDQWNHWVTVVGIVGDRVLVVDPANTKKNASENGIHSLSRPDLLRRWRHKGTEEPFYAFAVGK